MARVNQDDVADALIERFEEESPFNRRAFFALRGFTADWRKDLVSLLRSEEPIHPAVREVMAEAIESETVDGTHLDLIGGGENIDRFRAVAAREKWVEIGEWVDVRIAEGMKRKDALPLAEAEFGASYEKCRDALTYSRRCRAYVAKVLAEPKVSPYLTGDMLANVFHHSHIEAERKKKGRKKRGNASSQR
ncbi:hypothetical protein [Aurantiacibacter poecillastricola]|uniref:hypothetical protein n=1 Tax=Aurantiacibacter poecillastricola TaxID=3064385 RepID=UPI00273E60A2|nr:hypothetical protein [Aurantiacibacter sp. 219JJ12-13]MDP5263205.1 hypothetical protein [Aurantiacibacter sp. 219JJ12-13]